MASQQLGDAVAASSHSWAWVSSCSAPKSPQQQSDDLWLSGERQKATPCIGDGRILQRAAHVLGT